MLGGRCLSYGDGITFWPLAEVLRQAAGIVPEDTRRTPASSSVLLRRATGRRDQSHLVGHGPPEDPYGKDELFWGVRAVLEEMARRRPLVVVFDDIHWAEPIFLDLIEDILDASPGVPLLLVCTARHELREDRPGFAAGRRRRLRSSSGNSRGRRAAWWSRTSSARRACPGRSSGGSSRWPKATPCSSSRCSPCWSTTGCLRQQAGRWVFSGTAKAVSVPGNVSSLLGARLDRLGLAERRVVESASVIGLEFSSDAVSVLVQEDNARTDLGPALAALCRKKLIRRAEAGAADDFHFSHILIRDAAYARLLKRTRARLHERFAAWLADMVGPGSPNTKRSWAITSSSPISTGPSWDRSTTPGSGSAPRRRDI